MSAPAPIVLDSAASTAANARRRPAASAVTPASPADRERLELMPLRPLRFQVSGAAPAPRHCYSQGFAVSVLPASFVLALDQFQPVL